MLSRSLCVQIRLTVDVERGNGNARLSHFRVGEESSERCESQEPTVLKNKISRQLGAKYFVATPYAVGIH